MSAFFDLHHHFLYGLDDGASTKLEMQQMLVEAHKDGARIIIATPHITPGLTPISLDRLNSRIEEARVFSFAYGLDLELYLGSEIMYTYHLQRYLSERLLPTMAGSNKVLIEFPLKVAFSEIEDAVLNVLRAGYLPILAHIERYACLMHVQKHLDYLKKEYDVFFQVNADSILTKRDFFANRVIKRAIQDEMIDFIASDAHDTRRRASTLQKTYDKLEEMFGKESADRLTGNHQSIDWFFKI
ncbi:MAG: CpsB/CapC family capsule biosynthesis tyrosine phosphatase [Christensenella sp.]|nr:CpsB/CapC family capsule biosynthesis tyrosine phosphatase [Christensenella sp.]